MKHAYAGLRTHKERAEGGKEAGRVWQPQCDAMPALPMHARVVSQEKDAGELGCKVVVRRQAAARDTRLEDAIGRVDEDVRDERILHDHPHVAVHRTRLRRTTMGE